MLEYFHLKLFHWLTYWNFSFISFKTKKNGNAIRSSSKHVNYNAKDKSLSQNCLCHLNGEWFCIPMLLINLSRVLQIGIYSDPLFNIFLCLICSSLLAGYFPLESVHCLVWMCLDVLFCTASIMHLCTISIDRYLSLRYPMRFGRNKTRKRVTVKIIFVWLLSIAMSLPLCLMYSKAS